MDLSGRGVVHAESPVDPGPDSWNVQPGNNLVVLRANGSGKTTLLQLLAGDLWPTQGRLTVLGEAFGSTDLRELRKKIGWVWSFLEAKIPPPCVPLT